MDLALPKINLTPLHQAVLDRIRALGLTGAVCTPEGCAAGEGADPAALIAAKKRIDGGIRGSITLPDGRRVFTAELHDGLGRLGSLAAVSPGPDTPPEAMSRAVEMIADQSVKLFEHENALTDFTRQLSDSYDTIDLLYTVGRSMRAPYDPESFLNLILSRLHSTLSFDWLLLRFLDDPELPDGLRATSWSRGQPPQGAPGSLETLAATADAAASWRIMNDDPRICPGGAQAFVQPVPFKGAVRGMLAAGGKRGDDPMISTYDAQLLEAAVGFLTAFCDNVGLYEDQRSLFIGTVSALTAAIDAKDRYTLGHSERVAFLAAALSRELTGDKAFAERAHLAGLVHDVGKIGVPEAVLIKPGRLNDEEFAKIRLHPEIGHRILKDIKMLKDVLPAVLHHHERWDGKGYPARLSAEDIPLMARIMAVADTFDAMSSNRSYRPALPRDKVLEEIQRCAGTQFDPAVAPLIRRIDLAAYDALISRHASGAIGMAA